MSLLFQLLPASARATGTLAGSSHNARSAGRLRAVARVQTVVVFLTFGVAVAACATAAGGTGSSTGSGGAPSGAPAPTPVVRWPVKTSSNIDLWLHSFGVLTMDTTAVPLFKRNYRDSITAVKNRSNVLTSLDANRETLMKRLSLNPALTQAQFLVFEFASFAELRGATETFLQFQGEPSRAPDQVTASMVARLGSIFSTAADREWLRLFIAGVVDEQSRFYEAEYQRVSRQRAAVLLAVDSVWQTVYRQKFERFLNNTSQRTGEIFLSLPLGGEGRAAIGPGNRTLIAVPFPERPTDALQSIFVFAHEVTGNLVGPVVNDNTTPAQQRDGMTASFIAMAQVHAGLILLQKIAPELTEPYARYYLAQGGKKVPTINAVAALGTAFPLPAAIVNGIARQIEIVLAGI